MSELEITQLLAIGLAAGLLGGLLGIGGSIVMIPALQLVLGANQHLYQAAAMIVNIIVALAATLQHVRADAVRRIVVLRMLPIGIVMIVIGVEASDQLDGRALQQLFGVFLLYVIYDNVAKLFQSRARQTIASERIGWVPCSIVGGIMAFLAGLLGIGGGIIAVPLLQRVCRLPLRQCIACSSALMCLTAIVGAARKNMTLPTHVDLQSDSGALLSISDSFLIATCLAPTALLGGLLGATLTHRVPLRWLRVAFVLLMVWASMKMLGIV